MRPKSIVQFERVVLLSIAIGIVQSILYWDHATAAANARGFGPGVLVGAQLFGIAIYLLLLWFIARKGSFMARGIYVVLTIIGVAMSLFGLGQVETVPLIFTIVQALLSLISIWLLFRPDANAWFSQRRLSADPE